MEALLMEQTKQQAIEAHLEVWAQWYTRLKKISSHSLIFPTWKEEEQAGMEAWNQWDEAFRWLEAHGIFDEHILYDEQTEQATIVSYERKQ
jgi:hypothetical protein